MARWSNVEKNGLGAVSAKWPRGISHWDSLHESIGGLRSLLEVLDNAFEAIDADGDLSSSGKTKRKIAEGASVLKELESYSALEKASNAVARRIEKVREKITVLPGQPLGAAEIAVAAEIRAAIKAEADPEKYAFGLRSDARVVQAVLGAPGFLSGLSDQAVDRLRESALHALHPKEVAEIDELTAAEKVARDALAVARERIAARAGFIKGPDGTWTAPDAAKAS
jgi:hypothetical protein